MIFVTVGTQKFQMDRLLKAVDEIANSGTLNECFSIQTGHSTYTPKYSENTAFLQKEEMEERVDQCSILLSHAGVGSILMGLKRGKKVIVIPRMQKFGEHVDDHQIEIASSFAKAGYVKMVTNIDALAEEIRSCKEWTPRAFESNKDSFNRLVLDMLAQ